MMFILRALLALTVATPALAISGPTAPTAPDQEESQGRHHAMGEGEKNSCFGQARAYYGSTTNNVGYYVRQRKGDNPEDNALWTELYCAVDEVED